MSVASKRISLRGDAFPGQAGVPAPGGGDSYAVFLSGYLQIDNTGNPGNQWTFGVHHDDETRLRIDLDGDGVLEGNITNGFDGTDGETVIAHTSSCCGLQLGQPVTIPDGIYKFEAVYTEGGGGDYGEFFYAPGNPGFSTTNYALIGETEKAFEWLERGYRERDPRLLNLKFGPAFDPLRSDPRFDDLLRRIGFPEE